MLRLLLSILFITTTYSKYIALDPSDLPFEIPVVCTSGYYFRDNGWSMSSL